MKHSKVLKHNELMQEVCYFILFLASFNGFSKNKRRGQETIIQQTNLHRILSFYKWHLNPLRDKTGTTPTPTFDGPFTVAWGNSKAQLFFTVIFSNRVGTHDPLPHIDNNLPSPSILFWEASRNSFWVFGITPIPGFTTTYLHLSSIYWVLNREVLSTISA